MTWLKRITAHLTLAGLVFLPAASVQAETFQEALISAYQSHPRLLAERARLREIDETYVQARGQGRLQSDITGSVGAQASRSEFDFDIPGFTGGSSSSTAYPHSAQLQIIQPLYLGGRVRALKQQAKAGVLAARENLRSSEQEILMAAATAYIDVVRDEKAALTRRNNVRTLTLQKVAAQDRFDVGEGTRTDIAQAESRMAGAEIALANAEAQLQISRANYTRTIGHIPSDLQIVPDFALPATLSRALDLAGENNPAINMAVYNEAAADANIDVEKSNLKPTLSLNGTAQGLRGQSSGLSQSETATLSLQARIPILSGGVNRSRIRAAQHAKTRMGFETRDTVRFVNQNVAQIWAQLEASRQTLSASKQQVSSARVAFEGVTLEQDVGTRNTLDVLDAEREVLNAELNVLEVERSLHALTFQLLTALGAFTAEGLQLPIELYDPSENFEDVTSYNFFDRLGEAVSSD